MLAPKSVLDFAHDEVVVRVGCEEPLPWADKHKSRTSILAQARIKRLQFAHAMGHKA